MGMAAMRGKQVGRLSWCRSRRRAAQFAPPIPH